MQVSIQVPQAVDPVSIFGVGERNLKMIRESLGVKIAARDRTVQITGDAQGVDAARLVLDRLISMLRRHSEPTRQQILDLIAEAGWRAQTEAPAPTNGHSTSQPFDVYANGRPVRARSENQQHYLDAILTHDMVFCCGPAGTGKTYLAVAAAIHMLKTGRVKRAALVRPAVEAGEKLGFLPGDQFAKVHPYLRPLFDALHDMMDFQTLQRFLASDVIEVVPLAYMRGRTLNDSVIILDEAQNTTRGQMHMFLTRMGQRSKMIVTGDTTQIDLDDPRDSGLVDAIRLLRRTPGIAFCALEKCDVVRHDLVQRIIEAYERRAHPEAPAPVEPVTTVEEELHG